MGWRYLLALTALIEAGTGLALLAAPSVVSLLLLGVEAIAPEALVLCRIAGGALLAISVSCWTARSIDSRLACRGMLAAVLIYDVAAAITLAASGALQGMAGIALWPAVALHTMLAIWCLACLWSK